MSSEQINPNQLKKHNATYLRNLADLIESGEYEMDGTGGASVEGDNIVVFIDAVFKPSTKINFAGLESA